MIIPMLCVTIFVILVVWFLLPRVARLMIHTPTAISIFVCLKIGRAVQQECRDRPRMPSSACKKKIADAPHKDATKVLDGGAELDPDVQPHHLQVVQADDRTVTL